MCVWQGELRAFRPRPSPHPRPYLSLCLSASLFLTVCVCVSLSVPEMHSYVAGTLSNQSTNNLSLSLSLSLSPPLNSIHENLTALANGLKYVELFPNEIMHETGLWKYSTHLNVNLTLAGCEYTIFASVGINRSGDTLNGRP